MIHVIYERQGKTYYGYAYNCYWDNGIDKTIYSMNSNSKKYLIEEDQIIEMGDKQNLIKKYPEFFI